jgi:hypothetical protein
VCSGIFISTCWQTILHNGIHCPTAANKRMSRCNEHTCRETRLRICYVLRKSYANMQSECLETNCQPAWNLLFLVSSLSKYCAVKPV